MLFKIIIILLFAVDYVRLLCAVLSFLFIAYWEKFFEASNSTLLGYIIHKKKKKKIEV